MRSGSPIGPTRISTGKAIEAALNAQQPGVAHSVQLDLNNLADVKAFAARFREQVPALDLLANIAGLMLPNREVTAAGFEKTFAIGYLSAYLLCTELTDSLARAPEPRIVNVSGVPRFVLSPSLDLEDLAFAKHYKGMDVAIKTVHAKTVMTQTLAERLKERAITVNAFHPGAVQGDVMRNMGFPMNMLFRVVNAFMSKNSKSGVHVTTSPEVAGVTGAYFVGTTGQPLDFPKAYRDELTCDVRSKRLFRPDTERRLCPNLAGVLGTGSPPQQHQAQQPNAPRS